MTEKPKSNDLNISTADSTYAARLLFAISTSKVNEFFEHLQTTFPQADLVLIPNVPSLGTAHIVLSNAAYVTLSRQLSINSDTATRPAAATAAMAGLLAHVPTPEAGGGVLSEPASSPINRAERAAVTDIVPNSSVSSSQSYLAHIQPNVEAAIEELLFNSESTAQEMFMQRRLTNMLQQYFNNEITAAQMHQIFAYISGVIANLLPFSMAAIISDKPNWHRLEKLLKRGLWKEKLAVDAMLENLVSKRILLHLTAEPDQIPEQDTLQRIISHIEEKTGQPLGYTGEDGRIQIDAAKVSLISSGLLQIIFAAAETTTALWMAILHIMSQEPGLVAQLKFEASTYYANTGSTLLNYQDLKGPSNSLPGLINLVARALSKYPPVPYTFRTVTGNIMLGKDIAAANDDTLVFALGAISSDTLSHLQDQMGADDLTKLASFLPNTPNFCPGANSAILEVLQLLYTLLLNTDEIILTNPGRSGLIPSLLSKLSKTPQQALTEGTTLIWSGGIYKVIPSKSWSSRHEK
jgi:hypothetical protein